MNGTEDRREERRHPIQVAANRSGLSPDVLRAWEKRYAAVEPDRTGGGQRRYSDEDIERLRILREVTEAGRRIGDVAERSTGELARMVREDRLAEARLEGVERGMAERAAPHLEQALEAVDDLDPSGLREGLDRAQVLLGPEDLLDGLVAGLMHRVGERWQEGRLGPGEEHVASGVVRRFLMDLLVRLWSAPEAPRMVIAAPAGERHEIGALLAACTAVVEGWDVLYAGPDLPAGEISELVRRRGAALAGVSIVHPVDRGAVVREVRRLAEDLPRGCGLVAGGAGAAELAEELTAAGARVTVDLAGLRRVLGEVRGSTG
ncbi:MAG: MerR family transcriptional regulator [bacterium]